MHLGLPVSMQYILVSPKKISTVMPGFMQNFVEGCLLSFGPTDYNYVMLRIFNAKRFFERKG